MVTGQLAGDENNIKNQEPAVAIAATKLLGPKGVATKF